MEFTQPKVFMLAHTSVNDNEVGRFLHHLGAREWSTDASTSAEELIEIAGRSCYRSFGVGLNPNVKKVREGNTAYIGNILKQRHGSVLEHATVTFGFVDVSRVFTHEIVRHRHCSFSQESLRYVRLEDLKAYLPQIFQQLDRERGISLGRSMANYFEEAEDVQKEAAEVTEIDEMGFDEKKKLTSAMRRLAPIGLATMIIVTTNHRHWRHIISQRTSIHAEEEIRLVMQEVARQLRQMFPAIYQDMQEDSEGSFSFSNEGV